MVSQALYAFRFGKTNSFARNIISHTSGCRPFVRVAVFELQWSSGEQGPTHGAPSTDVTGANAAVTFWQPQVGHNDGGI